MRIEWKSCVRLGVTCFAVFLAIYYWSSVAGFLSAFFGALKALIIGCVIAFVLNILMDFYERRLFKNSAGKMQKFKRPVCLILAILTLCIIVALLLLLVVPELAECITILIDKIPAAIETATVWVQESGFLQSDAAAELWASIAEVDWQAKISQMVGIFLDGLGGAAQVAVNAVGSMVSIIGSLVIGLVFALYILGSRERLGSQINRVMKRYMKPGWYEKTCYALCTFNMSFRRFIVGQCTEAVILGVLCILGMTICRFPYAVMIGTLVGFMALIPIAGAFIGGAVGAFMIFTVSPVNALFFIIFLVVLQQLEGNLIYPKVVGSSLGLPGLWLLAAVTVGGGLAGIPGMLIGVPLVAAVYQLIKNDVNKAEALEIKTE